MRLPINVFLGLMGWAAMCLLGSAVGQSPEPATKPGVDPKGLNIEVPAGERDGQLATLHVYTNLMQVPVLVLTSDHQRMKPVPESKFRLSLDSGPPFKPTHVRREGEDPIELGILIDASYAKSELLPKIGDALEGLVPGYLREWDHVSVYVMDCKLIRTAYDLPADGLKLRQAVDTALQPWRERQSQKHPTVCKPSLPLWASIGQVTRDLSRLPGRRVLVAVTSGVDQGSRTTWGDVMKQAQRTSTAVFGLRTHEEIERRLGHGWDYRSEPMQAGTSKALETSDNPFGTICESSGGLEMPVGAEEVGKTLRRLTEMVRERYIVEYPRSNEARSGEHSLQVSIGNSIAYVRAAGITVPLADKKLLDNPLTIPTNLEKVPETETPKGETPPS